jgi:hypothetical protein
MTDTGFAQQIDSALLEDTGAYAAQHIVRGLALNQHMIDACFMQQGA